MDEAATLLIGKVGEYVRGAIGVSDLYAWLASRDADVPIVPSRWGEVWQLLHSHYAEGLAEPALRAELARVLSPAVEVSEGPAALTVARSNFQMLRPFHPAVTVQLRMTTA